ncbi:MAG: serine hydrolase [Patescibacteria group bacterium]
MINSLFGLFLAASISKPSQVATVVRQLPKAPDAQPMLQAPVKKERTNIGVDTTSKAIFVADAKSGAVLYAKRSHDVMSIASLTKLMTAMVYLDTKPNLDAQITIEEGDIAEEGSSIFSAGDVMTQRQAFEAMLVGSVNTAANALARVSLGNEAFVAAMNEKAKALHLVSPNFVEPTGLDPLNKASAADVAAMLSTALAYPEVKSVMTKPQSAFKTQTGHAYAIPTTNLLLTSFLNKNPYQILGAKTGSLPAAGYCMALLTRDAEDHEVIVASLGSVNHFSRFQDVKAATAWAFDSYEWK